MNEKTRVKLLKIFAGGNSINEVYERKDGELVPVRIKATVSPRAKEKEEMKRLREEMKDEK